MSIRKKTKLIIGAIAIVALFCFNVNLVKDSGNVANISMSDLITSASADDENGYSGMTCYNKIPQSIGGYALILCGYPHCIPYICRPGTSGECP